MELGFKHTIRESFTTRSEIAGPNNDYQKFAPPIIGPVTNNNTSEIRWTVEEDEHNNEDSQYEWLTKDLFKGDAYEAAETLATDTVGATNADDSCAAAGAPATDTAGATNEDEEIHTYQRIVIYASANLFTKYDTQSYLGTSQIFGGALKL